MGQRDPKWDDMGGASPQAKAVVIWALVAAGLVAGLIWLSRLL